VYSDSELYYGGVWKSNPELRSSIFQTSKSASRDRNGALNDLSDSLQRLGTDHLDLWQIHDVRTDEDFARISGPGGALEAFISAKENGTVKNIGVTGHHDPHILSKAVEQWPIDTVLMPVNPVEEVIGGFLTDTLVKAKEKGVAVIGMKVLGAGHYIVPGLGITAQLLIRYALSCGITLAIVGCSSPQEVRELSGAADLPLLSDSERKKITELFAPHARELAFYRGVR
jgi:aryl-alcohol dehydrogenase-like predicted oxidoreductase